MEGVSALTEQMCIRDRNRPPNQRKKILHPCGNLQIDLAFRNTVCCGSAAILPAVAGVENDLNRHSLCSDRNGLLYNEDGNCHHGAERQGKGQQILF